MEARNVPFYQRLTLHLHLIFLDKCSYSDYAGKIQGIPRTSLRQTDLNIVLMKNKVGTPLLNYISKDPLRIDVSLGNLKIKFGILRLNARRYRGVIRNLVLKSENVR